MAGRPAPAAGIVRLERSERGVLEGVLCEVHTLEKEEEAETGREGEVRVTTTRIYTLERREREEREESYLERRRERQGPAQREENGERVFYQKQRD